MVMLQKKTVNCFDYGDTRIYYSLWEQIQRVH
jgi:hypothetical protein